MAYNPETQKSVLISRDLDPKLQALMVKQKRTMQATLDTLIEEAYKKAFAKV